MRCAALLVALASPSLSAHDLGARDAVPWRSAWSFEPWVVACLLASAGLYALGLWRLWRRAGSGRGVGRAQVAAFVAGWLVLVVALVTPLDAAGSELFSVHMVQHELLMVVAAPLMILGRPLAVWIWALPLEGRRATGRFFHRPAWRWPWLVVTGPLAAWAIHAVVLCGWHVPALFDAALANNAVHTLQHTSFLLSALVFWWSILGAATRREQGVALLSLFTTFVYTGALGALLTLSRLPWYSSYLITAPRFGISALEDQQIGGLVMWVPTGFVYLVCGLMLASRWISSSRSRPGAMLANEA